MAMSAKDWSAREAYKVASMTVLPEGFKMTITPQPWIPVGERLPEDCVDVLVSWGSPESELFIAHWRADEQEWFDDQGKRVPAVRLTHWMPLPEPPEVK